jgi:hypothetical protein
VAVVLEKFSLQVHQLTHVRVLRQVTTTGVHAHTVCLPNSFGYCSVDSMAGGARCHAAASHCPSTYAGSTRSLDPDGNTLTMWVKRVTYWKELSYSRHGEEGSCWWQLV